MDKQNRIGDIVNITVPTDLVLRLLPQEAILQMQIGPIPLRPDLDRPASRPHSGRSSRPDSARTFRPASRPDSGRSLRPASPASRCPNLNNVRPISPYTDWSSLGEAEAEVISINSGESDNDYVPPEPMYEPDSPRPEPVEEPEDPRPGHSREEGAPKIFTDSRDREPSREVGTLNIPDPSGRERASNDISARPRVFGRGRGIPIQHVTPFFRGMGHGRHFLGRVRPM